MRTTILSLFVGAGLFGLGIIAIPEVIKTIYTWPVNEPIAFRIVVSVYVAFGLLSILSRVIDP